MGRYENDLTWGHRYKKIQDKFCRPFHITKVAQLSLKHCSCDAIAEFCVVGSLDLIC